MTNQLKVGSIGYHRNTYGNIVYFKITKIKGNLYYYDFLKINNKLYAEGGTDVVHILETKNWVQLKETPVIFKGE
jgi:hypothetical protein